MHRQAPLCDRNYIISCYAKQDWLLLQTVNEQEKIVEEVYETKKVDLTAANLDAGKRTIEGSIRSMGLKLDY